MISIHAPRAGGDIYKANKIHFYYPFQSTPPVRGATNPFYFFFNHQLISIHAPRAGGDQGAFKAVSIFSISIHAPRAGGDI